MVSASGFKPMTCCGSPGSTSVGAKTGVDIPDEAVQWIIFERTMPVHGTPVELLLTSTIA